jgi:Alpha amylase, catalytic domain
MASRWGFDPVVYELNTAAWLHDITTRTGRTTTLENVPDEEWLRVTQRGVDAVWLMGVWRRSAEGVRLALESPSHLADFHAALPDFAPSDVIGSAYSIAGYEVDEQFGGRAGLVAARRALADRGARLIVDFVPNHVAPDHRWLIDNPEYFVQGDAADLERAPSEFLRVGETVIARGRDPYFPPWPDVAQLDAFAPGLRQVAVDTLVEIGHLADGVRCDMAMLMLNDVFRRTWGDRAGPTPESEYWSEVISAVRAVHPEMLFIAEAYWDLEWQLQQLGFDYCYDKRLYDRLVHADPELIRGHLRADLDYQQHLIRFTENHDERRAASALAPAQRRAAAVVIATVLGATLWHEGQFEGWRVHVPVLLGRRPVEHDDDDLRAFHLRLIEAAGEVRHGDWALCEVTGWPDNATWSQLLTWSWTDGTQRALVVVNYAAHAASAMVHPRWDDVAGRTWRLDDLVNGDVYERDGDDIAANGLYIALASWGSHLFAWTPVREAGSSQEVH